MNFFGNASAWVSPERIFFSLFYSLSRSSLAINEARMTFFNFLNFLLFFEFFWEISSSGRVETIPGMEFFFLPCPGLVWIEMKLE